jgi:Cu(I)/Ag(I) efflux system periplasmic protein CusF
LRFAYLLLALALAVGAAGAQDESGRLGPNEGEVLEVDRAAKEITLRHGPLPELSMDPMSMVFVVADPALLDRVKKGDRVTFKAGLVDGRFGVLSIRPVKARPAK